MIDKKISVHTNGKICPLNNERCIPKACAWSVEVEENDELQRTTCMIADMYIRIVALNLFSDSPTIK